MALLVAQATGKRCGCCGRPLVLAGGYGGRRPGVFWCKPCYHWAIDTLGLLFGDGWHGITEIAR